MIIIQKYIRKWMARRDYLKLLSATIFIQYYWRQVHARKNSKDFNKRQRNSPLNLLVF